MNDEKKQRFTIDLPPSSNRAHQARCDYGD
jgi:hypothetical protein